SLVSLEYSLLDSHQSVQSSDINEPIIACDRSHALRRKPRADASPAPIARLINQQTPVTGAGVQALAVVMHRVLIDFKLAKLIGEVNDFPSRQQRIYSAAVCPDIKRAAGFGQRGHPIVREPGVRGLVGAHDSQTLKLDKSGETADEQSRTH